MDTISNQIALRLGYLTILQGVVARLANSASAVKAGSVAMMTGLLACTLDRVIPFHWALFVLPGAVFMGFHAFFLQQERAFIRLYNTASDRPLQDVVGFRIDRQLLDSVREPLWKVACRPTVLWFHLLLVAGSLLVLVLAQGACPCC